VGVEWSTDGNLDALALALFVEVCAAAAAALLLVHRARWLALMRGKGGGTLPVPGAHAGGGMQPAP